MKKGKNGYILFMLMIVIGIVAVLYFAKDKDEVRYIDKVIDQKESALKDVNGILEKTNGHNKEIADHL
jgi:Tfp pilus assembly protein PilE